MKRLLCIIKKSILTVIAVMAALRHTIHRKLHRVVMANVMTGVLVLSLIFTGITVYVYSYDDGEAPAETSVNVADDNAYGILESIAKSDPEKTDVIIAEPEYKDVLTDGNVELEKDVPATEAEIEANSDTATGTEENAGDIAVLGETTPDDDGTKEKNSTIDENLLGSYNAPGEQDMTVNAYGYTGTYDG